jgi:DNA polymerase III subunit gamma/tau
MSDEGTKDGLAQDASGQAPGEYVVIARRYRPQAFDQLVGQQHVAQGLAAAIAASRVGHAYLFTGARGTGKTSTARILAKALNCVHGPTPTPCNECDICRSITAGDDMDVLEIDGASNRGIDEIRQLRQNVNVRPSRARFKVYIIDEVHMLTEPAFNALLKTLEEPPEHVKFIFCTTEPEKIPITILSRCQRFDFAGIQTKQIVERLRQIVAGEGVGADDEALEVLARRSGGSMRDSQSLLEQLLALGSKKITVADVNRLLGIAGTERIARIVEHVLDRNAGNALTELDQAVTEGVDVGQLLDQLLGYFRDVMATAVGCPVDALLHVSASQQDEVKQAAAKLGLETILAVLQILDQTISRLKYLTYPRTMAEIALVRICNLEDLDSLPKLISQLRDGSLSQPGGGNSAAQPSSVAAPSAAVSKKKSDERLVSVPVVHSSSGNESPSVTGALNLNGNGHSSVPLHAAGSGAAEVPAEVESNGVEASEAVGAKEANSDSKIRDFSPEFLLNLWREASSQLGGLAGEKAGQAVKAMFSAPDKLVVFFQKRYNFCKQFCERPEIASQLRDLVRELGGSALRIEFELAEDEPAEAVSPDKATNLRQRMYEVCQRPFVRQAMELFQATAQRLEEPARNGN